MDCRPTGSSVHGIFQARILEWVVISFSIFLWALFFGEGARILEWVVIPFSRGSSQPRDWTWVSSIIDRRFTVWATREVNWATSETLFDSDAAIFSDWTFSGVPGSVYITLQYITKKILPGPESAQLYLCNPGLQALYQNVCCPETGTQVLENCLLL